MSKTSSSEQSRDPNLHLSVLLCIHHSGDRDTEVGDGAPEVYKTPLTVSSLRDSVTTQCCANDMIDQRSFVLSWSLVMLILLSSHSPLADLGAGSFGKLEVDTYGLSRHSRAPHWSGSWR